MALANVSKLAALASRFKALHVPGNPVLLANVYDHVSATAVASLPDTKVLATTSFGVAQAVNADDNDLTLEQDLAAAKIIAAVALKHDIPATVDFQDGYGDQIIQGTKSLIECGVVGMNLEDYSREKEQLYKIDENATRIQHVLATAAQLGVPDFVVNARCDALLHGGKLPEAIERGKAYLAAGATTVFVLGKISTEDIKEMVEAFQGRLNVGLPLGIKVPNGFNIQDLKTLGVARVSVGPRAMIMATEEYKRIANEVIEGKA